MSNKMSNEIKVKSFPKTSAEYEAKVLAAYPCECNWQSSDPNAYCIALAVETTDGQFCDYWTQEISTAYSKVNQDITNWQFALEQLQRIGWNQGTNFSEAALQTLVGQTITINTYYKEGKERVYVNLGPSNFTPKRLDAASLAAKQSAMFGNSAPASLAQPQQQSQQQQPQQQQPQQSAGNPFQQPQQQKPQQNTDPLL
jgi:hypothetical protein